MSERRSTVGLYDIVEKRANSDQFAAFVKFANAAGIQRPTVRIMAWIDADEGKAIEVLRDLNQPGRMHGMAERVIKAAAAARAWLEGIEDPY